MVTGCPMRGRRVYGLTIGDAADGAVDADGDGRTNLQECQDGTHPRGAYTRYLAEGATGTLFDARIAIANPNQSPAHVLLRFLKTNGQVIARLMAVPAMERRFVTVELIPGLSFASFSTAIESDVEIVVDRTMSWDDFRLRQPRGDERARGRAHVVSRGRRDARPVRSVLPAPESEPDRDRKRARALPAADRQPGGT